MISKKFSLFLILGALNSFGAFSFQARPASATDFEFKKYILPQAKSISREFYILLQDFHPQYREYLKVKTIIDVMINDFQAYEKQCLQTSELCERNLMRIKNNWDRIGALINIINVSHSTRVQSFSPKMDLELQELTLKHLEIGQKLNSYFLFSGSIIAQRYSLSDLKEELIKFKKSYEVFFLSPLSSNVKNIYTAVYHYYISPLETYVIYEQRKDYLIENIEKLNFAWNTFHMKIAKTNLSVSSGTKKLATQVHRRWNSILKILLK